MVIRHPSAIGVLVIVMGSLTGTQCRPAPTQKTVSAGYDTFTSRLVQLAADLNGDGRLDQWTYMDGTRPIRGEGDLDGDGRIDRWEYFDDQAKLVRLGTSSRNDGVEDTWTSPASSNGELPVARSRHRDRAIDRREITRAGVLVSAEEDTNGDGRPDKWEIYDGGVIREVRLDTSLTRGFANRRLVYDDQGRLTAIESDDDGDGRFEPLAGAVPARPRPNAPEVTKR